MTGLTQPNLSILPITDFIHHDDFPVFFDQYDKILNKEDAASAFELRIVDQDGGIKWLEVHAIRINWDEKPAVLNFASETTERRCAEEALRMSEERFRLAAHSASDLIYEWDILGNSLEWYGNIDEILGYAPNEFPRTLEAWGKIIHPDDYDRVIDSIGNSLRERNHFSEEYRIRCKDGSYRYWIDRGTPPSVISANQFKWVRVVSDVTESKKATEDLKIKNLLLATQQEAALDGILVIGKSGDILSYNQKFADIWEIPPEIMASKSDDLALKCVMDKLVDPQQFIEKVEHLYSHQNETCRDELALKDGRVFERYSAPMIDEADMYFGRVWYFRDITERKNSERKLKIFSDAVEGAHDGVLMSDLNGRINYVNESIEKLFGYSREELMGKSLDSLSENPEVAKDIFETVRDKGRWDGEVLSVRKDETTFLAALSVSFIKSQENIPVGTMGILRDISERKQMEETLRESREVLHAVLNSIPARVFWKDRNLLYLGCNTPFARDAGFERPEDIIGKDDHAMGWREQAELYQADDRLVIESGIARLNIEEPQTTPSGEQIYLLTSKLPLRDADGVIVGVLGTYHDITDRKKAEKELRASEERYKLVVENANEAIFVAQDLNIRFSNSRLPEILGYPIGSIIDRPFVDFIHPEDRDLVVGRHKARLAGEKVESNYVFRAITSDGNIRWIEINAIKIVWNGQLASLNFGKDITEQKQASENLIESERKFRTIFEHSSEAAFILTDKFLDCNQKACELLGYEREEIIGHSPADFSSEIQPDGKSSAEAAMENTNAAIAGKHQYFYWQHKRKNGTLIDTEVSLTSVTIEGKLMLHAVTRDISQRKHAEESLRRLATVIEQLADGVVILDTDGFIQYVNPSYEKITGNSRDEVNGKLYPIFESNAENTKTHDEVMDSLKSGRAWAGTLQGIKKDGKHFDESITISPVFDASNLLINYVAIKRDITRQVALEQQLLQSQKMEAIGQLAGGVAHDFNNLLSVILGYSEILQNKLYGQDGLKEDVGEIAKAGYRAANLTRQLLVFSRKQIIQPKVLNLNSTVNDVNKMLGRLIGENVELVTEIDDDLWQIKADPGQIEQIIMNLALNARDAMPGGGKLTIKTANALYKDLNEAARIRLISQDYITLTVTDNGTGMPEEIGSHIFEPFFTTKEQGKGTGLGLATVYGIVEQNNGAIEVESKVGFGTTFKIYWPRNVEIASKAGSIDAQVESIGGNETILIVEDEEMVRDLMGRLLKGLGYKTLVAGDPQEAIELCRQFKDDIHLLLTDVVMPKMNGEELARAAKKIIPEISILFMSGYTDNSFIRHEALESQGDFLPKPFSKEVLARKIREIIERDALRKAGGAVAIR